MWPAVNSRLTTRFSGQAPLMGLTRVSTPVTSLPTARAFSISLSCIAGVLEVVASFVGGDPVERVAEGGPQLVHGAEAATAEFVLDFGERLLDRVEVRAIR